MPLAEATAAVERHSTAVDAFFDGKTSNESGGENQDSESISWFYQPRGATAATAAELFLSDLSVRSFLCFARAFFIALIVLILPSMLLLSNSLSLSLYLALKKNKKKDDGRDSGVAARRPRRAGRRAAVSGAGRHRRPPRRAGASLLLRESGGCEERFDAEAATASQPRRWPLDVAPAHPDDGDDDDQQQQQEHCCRCWGSLSDDGDGQRHRNERFEFYCCCSSLCLHGVSPGSFRGRRGGARDKPPRSGEQRRQRAAAERFRCLFFRFCFFFSLPLRGPGRPPDDRQRCCRSPQGLLAGSSRWRGRRGRLLWHQPLSLHLSSFFYFLFSSFFYFFLSSFFYFFLSSFFYTPLNISFLI